MAGSPNLHELGGPEFHPLQNEPPKQETNLEEPLEEQIQKINEKIERLEMLRRKNWEKIEAQPQNKGLQEQDMRSTTPAQRKREDSFLKDIEELRKLKILLEQKKNLGTPTAEIIQ